MKALTPNQRAIILASGSPRRRELVRRIGLKPVVRVSTVEEVREHGESAEAYARRLAAEKGRDVAARLADNHQLPGWILSADTIVVHDGDVLEKPADEREARQMLHRLAGTEHEVITAFCWLWRAPGEGREQRREVVQVASASVWMRDLDAALIARYVETGEPMDKAGGYGIQDIGAVLVRRLEGSYFAVVGLPVCEVIESLQQLGGLQSYPFQTLSTASERDSDRNQPSPGSSA